MPIEEEGHLVRRASERDVAPVAALEAGAFDHPWSPHAVLQALTDAGTVCWVAESSGALVGWIAFRITADEAELLRMAVADTGRRQGIASRLLAAGWRHLRQTDAKACYLEVREDNVPALTLYRRHGFEVVGRRPSYYPDGTAARVLTRRC